MNLSWVKKDDPVVILKPNEQFERKMKLFQNRVKTLGLLSELRNRKNNPRKQDRKKLKAKKSLRRLKRNEARR